MKGDAMKDLIEMREEERGIALVSTLMSLLVLSTMSVGIVFVTQTGTWSAINYKTVTQARFEAEAGLQRTLQWFNTSYTAAAVTYGTSTDGNANPTWNGEPVVLSALTGSTSNYPTTAVGTSYNNTLNSQGLNAIGVSGNYSTKATLLRTQGNLETWRVTSQGNIHGTRDATMQAEMVIEQGGTPVYQYGITGIGYGCDVVSLGSGGLTDSFDSSQGSYAATQLDTDGNIGANGNVDLTDGSIVHGSVNTILTNTSTGNCDGGNPNQVSVCSGCSAGGVTVGSQPLSYPTPAPISPAPPTNRQNIRNECPSISGCTVVTTDEVFALAPGAYGNLELGDGKIVQVTAGTYTVNTLNWSGGASIQVMSGPVVINIAGAGLKLGDLAVSVGGGGVVNPTDIPRNLQFVYGGTYPVEFGGGSAAYALVYAPNATIKISGGGDWYGAALGKILDNTGGSAIHYDRSLRNNFFIPGPYRPISYSLSRY